MIEVRDLYKSYGRKAVLKGVTFTIKPNEITCITGLNGTGKTTLMNCIVRLTPADKGVILLDNEQPDHHLYERIAYIPDSITMPRTMTIQEAMEFMATYYTRWNQAKADELVRFFKLKTEDKIKEHSKGNQAKINFLLGLSLDADYYLMDEPFSGIDIFAREQILEVFTSKFVVDKGVLLATHHLDEVEVLVDRIVMLEGGEIQRDFYAEDERAEGKSVIDVMREVYQA